MTLVRSEIRAPGVSYLTLDSPATRNALSDELLVHMFGRANVQPSRRLLRNHRRRFVRELARNHNLLQIAA